MTTDTRGEKSRRVQEGRFERLAMLSFVTWVFFFFFTLKKSQSRLDYLRSSVLFVFQVNVCRVRWPTL